MLSAQECVAILASLAAAAIDVRTRRIPNAISFGLIGIGLGMQTLAGGLAAGGLTFLLVAAVIVAGSFAHARGWLGGGDVKLIAGCVACIGPAATPDFLLFTALAGGLLAIGISLREGQALAVFGNVAFAFFHGPAYLRASASTNRLPYAVAISAGLVATVTLRSLSFVRLPL